MSVETKQWIDSFLVDREITAHKEKLGYLLNDSLSHNYREKIRETDAIKEAYKQGDILKERTL